MAVDPDAAGAGHRPRWSRCPSVDGRRARGARAAGRAGHGPRPGRRAAPARPRCPARALRAIPERRRARDELWGLTVTRPGPRTGPRLCLNGHVDVVAPGDRGVGAGPLVGPRGRRLRARPGLGGHEGGVVAALHAMAAARGRASVRGGAHGRGLRGGRRPGHVRRAGGRRPLRRLPDPRADRAGRGLRPGGVADLRGRGGRPRRPRRRCGWRASRRSTATWTCTWRWRRTNGASTTPSSTS